MTGRDIILECVTVGSALRVTAIDTATGTEVVFQAPAATSRPMLERLAVQKIAYVQNRERKT